MAADDGFREIQLNGKQLVFLFMATTIVAVVIFLCGVMVGRGVKGGAHPAATAEAAPPAPDAVPADGPPAGNAPGAAGEQAGVTAAAQGAQPPSEDLTYYSRLGGGKAPADDLKKPALPSEPPPEVPDDGPTVPPEKPATSPQPAAQPASQAPAAGAAADPAREGWAVQVAALAQKNQADSIARRLATKGYDAYVLPPPPGGGMYRVRVGKFKERRDADSVMRRLEKEEQFKPWITR